LLTGFAQGDVLRERVVTVRTKNWIDATTLTPS